MKKIFIFLIILILGFSCSKVEEEPYGFLANENFYTSEDNVYSGLLYAYEATKRPNFYFAMLNMTQLGLGIVEKSTSYKQWNADDFYLWSFNPLTETIRQFFGACYTGIYRANTVLNNIDAIDFTDDALKEQYRGEAKFIRAFFYFYLVRIYGEVPVYTSQTDPEASANTPASSIQEVYELIIRDLRFAAENVPAFYIPGRADKTAAEALLSKVYLHMASSNEYGSPRYDWVGDYNQMYDSSAYFASSALNSSVFDLDVSIFETFPDNERTSKEKLFIWSVDLDGDEVGRTPLHTRFMPYTYYSQFYTEKPGTDSIVPYWGGWSVTWYNEDYLDTHLPGDKRTELYMETRYDSKTGVNPERTPPHCLKYASKTSSFYNGASTIFWLRLSDIALVYAEAVGPTTEGYEQINRIRQRADIPDLTPGLSRTEFIEAVWQERFWELAMEGHTFFDLRRTHRMNGFLDKQVPYAYLYPLPQREIDLNKALGPDPEKETLN